MAITSPGPITTKFPTYGVIDEIQTRANSNYSSLQASLRTLNWHGVVSQFHYTWAHALDISTFGGAPQDSTNPNGDYGNSDFDTRHNFTAFVQYQIPGSSRGPNWLTHGWTVNSTLSFRSGLPFNLDAIGDWSGTGENLDRPVLIGNPYAGVSHQPSSTGVYWFNPNAFAFPNPGSFGTYRRNQLYGPNFKRRRPFVRQIDRDHRACASTTALRAVQYLQSRKPGKPNVPGRELADSCWTGSTVHASDYFH